MFFSNSFFVFLSAKNYQAKSIEHCDQWRNGNRADAKFRGNSGERASQIIRIEDAADVETRQRIPGDDDPATPISVELGNDLGERHVVEDQLAAPPRRHLFDIPLFNLAKDALCRISD